MGAHGSVVLVAGAAAQLRVGQDRPRVERRDGPV